MCNLGVISIDTNVIHMAISEGTPQLELDDEIDSLHYLKQESQPKMKRLYRNFETSNG